MYYFLFREVVRYSLFCYYLLICVIFPNLIFALPEHFWQENDFFCGYLKTKAKKINKKTEAQIGIPWQLDLFCNSKQTVKPQFLVFLSVLFPPHFQLNSLIQCQDNPVWVSLCPKQTWLPDSPVAAISKCSVYVLISSVFAWMSDNLV